MGGDPFGDARLGVGVHGGGWLDQHQDGGGGRQGTGEHDPLALPARKSPPALVEDTLPAAGQRVVDVLGVGHPQASPRPVCD